MQARALAKIGHAIQKVGLSVFVFSGYYMDELTSDAARDLLSATDVLVSGRYIETARLQGSPWRSSSNQRVHFLTDRHNSADMHCIPETEIRIAPDGQITLTGFPPDEFLLADKKPSPMS